MLASSNHSLAQPGDRDRRRFNRALVGFWLLFALGVVPVTWIGGRIKYGSSDLVTQVIWESGWAGWALTSFVVLALCRRFPVDRAHLAFSVGRLAAFGLGVVVFQVLVDFAINAVLGIALRHAGLVWKHAVFIAAYKSHVYYAVYWMIVGVAHAYEFHRRYRESELTASQLEAKLAQAELERLKTQLQPHFLFNAHHTIVALMLKKENAAAIRMLTRLSDLLRISLSRSGQQVVTLREELETLGLYLEIQRERFRDRLAIEIVAPEELQDAEVPHLLLQPVVENALLHGLEDVTENARLEIRISRRTDALVCEVRDNGAGFSPEKPQSDGASPSGIGLPNTRDRLQQLYGSNQTLVIASLPGQGCTVTIQIPFRRRAAARPVLAS